MNKVYTGNKTYLKIKTMKNGISYVRKEKVEQYKSIYI